MMKKYHAMTLLESNPVCSFGQKTLFDNLGALQASVVRKKNAESQSLTFSWKQKSVEFAFLGKKSILFALIWQFQFHSVSDPWILAQDNQME